MPVAVADFKVELVQSDTRRIEQVACAPPNRCRSQRGILAASRRICAASPHRRAGCDHHYRTRLVIRQQSRATPPNIIAQRQA
jgi:hypothetical protein